MTSKIIKISSKELSHVSEVGEIHGIIISNFLNRKGFTHHEDILYRYNYLEEDANIVLEIVKFALTLTIKNSTQERICIDIISAIKERLGD